jgi:phosphomannomutase
MDTGSFKAYDVRGTYPDQLDELGAWAVGRAYARHLEPAKVAVGRDMRTMAPSVAAALIEGLVSAGVDVVDIGQAGTEMLYFTVASMELDGGIQVTASHNPKEYIGMKVVRRGAQPVGLDSGLDKVRDFAVAELAAVPQATAGSLPGEGAVEPVVGDGRGTVEQRDVLADFVERAAGFVDLEKISGLEVVLDAGNGVGGTMFAPLLERLPITAHTYNFEPDGTFPNHEPNPLLPENRQFIIDKVREHGADLGIAWDGDADRCFFVDDTGEFVPGDFITALLAELTLRREPGAKILYDVRASRAVADRVTAAGGTAIASRVGHAFIKQRIKAEGAAFAGEVSGHYYFSGFYGVDTGIVPALMMLQLVSEHGGKLSTLLAELRSHYFISGEINSRVDDVPMKLQQLKERYADARISHLDGVSIDYDDWHCNVRPSNTEPLLRLNLEAFSEADREARRDEVLELFRSSSSDRLADAPTTGSAAGAR